MSTKSKQPFIHEDFLLYSDSAKYLYFEHAAKMPIIDYHNHLPPDEIADNKIFQNITDIWLRGDHYKWRAMRAHGIDENYITGSATDLEKFNAWAETVPYTVRNPLFHWSAMELKRYFNMDDMLQPANAEQFYHQTSDQVQSSAYSTQQLLKRMEVRTLCTTDDPADDLAHHQRIKESEFTIDVLPAFRPDKYILMDSPDYRDHLNKLGHAAGVEIRSVDDLLEALEKRVQFFADHGCMLSDHGLNQIYTQDFTLASLNSTFTKWQNGQSIPIDEIQSFQNGILFHLCKMYHDKNWVMQFHLGALRNNNAKLQRLIGNDVGCDSIGDYRQAEGLTFLLNRLDQEDSLCRTILYNLNPSDNYVFASMAGNFQEGPTRSKIQFGSGWWFLDQKSGMEDQINTLSNVGLISHFVGMLTDSRSFLSFPRHEYFRRILCNLFGADMENGQIPNDREWMGKIVEDICYNNAKNYFGFK